MEYETELQAINVQLIDVELGLLVANERLETALDLARDSIVRACLLQRSE